MTIAIDDRPGTLKRWRADDVLSVVGSLVASVLVDWVLYERVLPTAGRLGFVVCWYLLFLVLYAVVVAQSNPRAVVLDRVAGAVVWGGAAIVGLALASALVFTVARGHAAMTHLNFFTKDGAGTTAQSPFDQGGVLEAIVGTLVEVTLAVAVSLPLGLGTALYMSEVGGRTARLVRTIIEAMTALPSIVAGLFVYYVLVITVHVPKSGLVAAMAIAVMMLPIIARSADVVLRVVPGSLREAGVALGSSSWSTVLRVVLPTARSGLATALILGVARGVGETSPVLLTSQNSTFLTASPLKPMSSLPLTTYFAVRNPDVHSITRGFASASTLIALVLLLFLVTRVLARGQRGPA